MPCLALTKLERQRLRERSVISVITCGLPFKRLPDETLSNPFLDSRCTPGRLSRVSNAQFCSDGNAGTHRYDLVSPSPVPTKMIGLVRHPAYLSCLCNSGMHSLHLPIPSSGAHLRSHPSLADRSACRRQTNMEDRYQAVPGERQGDGDLDCYGCTNCICG